MILTQLGVVRTFQLITKEEAEKRGLFIGHEIPWGTVVEGVVVDGNYIRVELPCGTRHIRQSVFKKEPK